MQKLGRGATGSHIHIGVAARKAGAAALSATGISHSVRQALVKLAWQRQLRPRASRGQSGSHRLWTAQGGEKEYYLASACKELYVAPTAGFTLKGFKVAGAAARF